MKLTKTVWMTDEEFVDFVATRSKFGQLNSEFADHPMMPSFSRDKATSWKTPFLQESLLQY